MLEISRDTARRFLLGDQGLWPGRRFRGLEGTEAAMRRIEHLQLDPLNVVARSQDLTLNSRVLDYRPEYLDRLTYGERKFFDWGNWLAIRPMEELPYWKLQFAGEVVRTRKRRLKLPNKLYDEVLGELTRRGPLGNRDFAMKTRVESYRGRKDSAVALFHLWIEGKVMTHSRVRFERVYDLAERVAPIPVDEPIPTHAEAERFFALKALAFHGLDPLKLLHHQVSWKFSAVRQRKLLTSLEAQGEIVPVRIEGWKDRHFVRRDRLSALERLQAGETPAEWTPLENSTREEVTFLAPLDIVSARGRAKKIFGFDYIWEVYKPEHARKWGYYTLPILYGDRLVARLDPKLDRTTGTLSIQGYWAEADFEANADYLAALREGTQRLARLAGAERVRAPGVRARSIRRALTLS